MVVGSRRDYYEVLGIERTATERDIAAAYRKLAIKYHPDSHPNDEEAIGRFKEAAEAYEVLSDSDKRARYDRFGHAGMDGAGQSGFHDVEDIFDAFGDIFGFNDLFGNRRRNRVRRGSHLKTEVTLDLEEAVRGVEKQLQFRRSRLCSGCQGSGAAPGAKPAVCQTCRGQGQVVQAAGILRVQTTCPACRGNGRTVTDKCQTCRGSGAEVEEVTLQVKIPQGVDDGMQIRLQGEGEPSPNGGPPGDCYCLIRVRKHAIFERDGLQLFFQMPITYTQAVLGADVEVPTLNGARSLVIPPGTPTGHVFRLPRLGVPDPHGNGTGDLLVSVFVEVPKKVSKEEETLLRRMAELEKSAVAPERKSFLERLREYVMPGGDDKTA